MGWTIFTELSEVVRAESVRRAAILISPRASLPQRFLTFRTLEELLRRRGLGAVGGDGDEEDQRGGDRREPPLSYPRLHLQPSEE